MQEFYAKRIPANYSLIASHIGDLEVKSGVRLSRVLYAQEAQTGDLTEISMDAGISGDYPQIMRFVNGLERDQTFFVIRAMALTGQQGGHGESAAASFDMAACGGCGQRVGCLSADEPGTTPATAPVPGREGQVTMALALGTENKRQVYLLIGLAGDRSRRQWLMGIFRFVQAASACTRCCGGFVHAPHARRGGRTREKLSNAGIDPALHLDKLAHERRCGLRGNGP